MFRWYNKIQTLWKSLIWDITAKLHANYISQLSTRIAPNAIWCHELGPIWIQNQATSLSMTHWQIEEKNGWCCWISWQRAIYEHQMSAKRKDIQKTFWVGGQRHNTENHRSILFNYFDKKQLNGIRMFNLFQYKDR